MGLTIEETKKFKKFVFDNIDDLNISDGDKLYLAKHLFMMLDKKGVEFDKGKTEQTVRVFEFEINGAEVPISQATNQKIQEAIPVPEPVRLMDEPKPPKLKIDKAPNKEPISYDKLLDLVRVFIGQCQKNKTITGPEIRKLFESLGYNLTEVIPTIGSAMVRMAKEGRIEHSHDIPNPDSKSKGRIVKVWRVL